VFKPSELEQMPIELERRMSELEMNIMQDIIRRIKINDEITRSADWQIYRMVQMGKSSDYIKQQIQQSLNFTDTEINNLYKGAIESGYTRDKKLYEATGKEFMPFKENTELQQLIQSVIKQTKSSMVNITQTLGFMIDMGGKQVFSPLSEYLQRTLDTAVMEVANGAFDYNSTLKTVISQMTKSGLRTVDYASGWSNRIEVAARRALMSGVTQVTSYINERNADELGTDKFEVSWHASARPSHQEWQGRVYTKQQLITLCGLGTGPGLMGWNCYHSYYPFIEGISEHTYNDKQLDAMNAKENTLKAYNGKEYTTYEAVQRQRQLETLMRKQRQDIKLLESGGAMEDDIINAKIRYQNTMGQYRTFSKAMEIPQQLERVYADNYGRMYTGKIAKPNIVNKSKFIDNFNIFNNGQKDTITLRNLQKNLNKTNIGKETVKYLSENPCRINMYYNFDVPKNEYGRQIPFTDEIEIYASNTKTVQKTVEVIIHEATHRKYNIGGDIHSECICKAQEYKHRYNADSLTGEQLRSIIKETKLLYPEFKWRVK